MLIAFDAGIHRIDLRRFAWPTDLAQAEKVSPKTDTSRPSGARTVVPGPSRRFRTGRSPRGR